MAELTEMDRGELFAARLYALCHEHGPASMNPAQREAMAKALWETAVEWTKAHNRARARQPTPSDGGRP